MTVRILKIAITVRVPSVAEGVRLEGVIASALEMVAVKPEEGGSGFTFELEDVTPPRPRR